MSQVKKTTCAQNFVIYANLLSVSSVRKPSTQLCCYVEDLHNFVYVKIIKSKAVPDPVGFECFSRVGSGSESNFFLDVRIRIHFFLEGRN